MPVISVPVSDDRHPEHDSVAEFLENPVNSFVGWEDMDESVDHAEIEVSWEEFAEAEGLE